MDRVSVFSCAWEYEVRNWTLVNVDSIYSNIYISTYFHLRGVIMEDMGLLIVIIA